MTKCLPGCRDAKTVVPHQRYECVVSERVGPFKVQFPMDIQVLEAEEHRRLKAQASGRDSSMGSTLKVILDLALEGTESGSRIRITSDTTIMGKLGTPGHGPGTFACMCYDLLIPTSAKPQVRIEYPAQPGSKPVVRSHALEDRC